MNKELSFEEIQKIKKASRRYLIARVCLVASLVFMAGSGILFYLVPEHFAGFSVVVTVGVGGLLGIVNLYMHHESKTKRTRIEHNME